MQYLTNAYIDAHFLDAAVPANERVIITTMAAAAIKHQQVLCARERVCTGSRYNNRIRI